MGPRFCMLCGRNVQPVRRLGAGFWLLVFLSGGIILLFYGLWPKRCPLCASTALAPPELHHQPRR